MTEQEMGKLLDDAANTINALGARVKELESVCDDRKSLHDLIVEQRDTLKGENSRLKKLVDMNQKVVDAARERVLDLITKVPFLDVVQGTDELQQLACDLDMERKTCNHHSIYADYKGRCGDCGELKK